ncbi:MAG: protein phosphatase 2C domain-containing protein [Myxococcota bacterium]|nr:protein phosphatase 2C domain-containing protein [Myxococcota bacterium]
MNARSAALSDVGRRRTVNEDAHLIRDDLGLYVVADGMGGHASGEVASREAVDTVLDMVARGRASLERVAGGDLGEEAVRAAVRTLESAVQAATYMVYAIAQNEPARQGMGTTVSALLLAGRLGVTAQVGDSRIYLVRGGTASRLTEDHTLVAWQIQQGILSPEEAATSPHKNVITRAVGSRDYVQVDTRVLDISPGDAFLLCTDGLHGYLDDGEIAPIVALGPDAAVRRFVAMANERGGRDNITAVVVALS